eukprot:CAMPEP_0181065618 /NCGR_PEP_ID=MMETSP1070-20121207/24833_1 /TAXON_ID=265543 /ORGANISM="Minutocellus polymorphus, Strain NH13" /LENGTH=71 /DNA_ID=CAMNT_0023146017 /DNA_START=272 /DNA_END=483 /DNA_ORIENTATION=+
MAGKMQRSGTFEVALPSRLGISLDQRSYGSGGWATAASPLSLASRRPSRVAQRCVALSQAWIRTRSMSVDP